MSPFLTIWTRPRETVRTILLQNPELYVTLLACLAGIKETLDRAAMRNMGDKTPVPIVVASALILGPLSGLFSLWMFSHLVLWAGRWMGGTASRDHLKTAIAWASVPVVVALPLWIPQLALFGPDLFTKETPRLDAHPLLLIPLIAYGLVEAVFGMWAFVLLCHTVAEVQGFSSAWRGFRNVFLAGAMVVVPLLLLALVVMISMKH
jgi:hypothetical protein